MLDMDSPNTTESAILRCLLDASGVKKVELIPVVIVDGQPQLMPREKGAKVLERIMRVTREQRALPE